MTQEKCPICGGELSREKNTFTGQVMREYWCKECSWSATINDGVALWRVLHDAKQQESLRPGRLFHFYTTYSMNPTRAGIVVFSIAVAFGPMYTVDGYSHVENLISHLGAQHAPNSWIMVLGFLFLGGGMVADGFRWFTPRAVPFMTFGGFMALVGLFPHMPLDSTVAYSVLSHQLHGVFASMAGIAVTAGLVWQAFVSESRFGRIVAIALAVLCVLLPILMLSLPEVQGLIQRIMYLALFIWIWFCFPERLTPGRVGPSMATARKPVP